MEGMGVRLCQEQSKFLKIHQQAEEKGFFLPFTKGAQPTCVALHRIARPYLKMETFNLGHGSRDSLLVPKYL